MILYYHRRFRVGKVDIKVKQDNVLVQVVAGMADVADSITHTTKEKRFVGIWKGGSYIKAIIKPLYRLCNLGFTHSLWFKPLAILNTHSRY